MTYYLQTHRVWSLRLKSSVVYLTVIMKLLNIFFQVKCTNPTLVMHNHFTYNFKKAEFDQFRDLLSEIPWKSCLLSRRKVHWRSEDAIRLIRKKKRLYKKAKQTDTQGDLL